MYHHPQVLYMTEPLDELTAQSITSYDGKRLMDVAKGNLDIPEETSEEAKAKKEQAEAQLDDVCAWLQEELKSKNVQKVEVSTRLTDSPATLVQGAYGMSPTMQRYMKAQVPACVSASSRLPSPVRCFCPPTTHGPTTSLDQHLGSSRIHPWNSMRAHTPTEMRAVAILSDWHWNPRLAVGFGSPHSHTYLAWMLLCPFSLLLSRLWQAARKSWAWAT